MPAAVGEIAPARRVRVPGTAFLGKALVVLVAGLGSCGKGSPAEAPAETYAFHPAGDELLRILFPKTTRATRRSNAYEERNRPPVMSGEDGDLTRHHVAASKIAAEEPVLVELGYVPLESGWLTATQRGTRADLLALSDRTERLASDLLRAKLEFGSVLEKALFQRDVYQMSAVFHQVLADGPEHVPAQRASAALGALWKSVLLSDREFEDLVALRPRDASGNPYVRINPFDLRKDYLPDRVYRPDPDWFELPSAPAATHHFKVYRGRSFFRIHAKVPGLTPKEFRSLWDEFAGRWHSERPSARDYPALPAGSELMLVRTFAVHLQTGECADSTFPEEVILRSFKTEREGVDRESSDYRGTYCYQYKARRRDLLARPASLGLFRIKDDNPSFFGFFGDVPGPTFGSGASTMATTMRNNCSSCHSEMFYGLPTVFSMRRKRPLTENPYPDPEGPIEEATRPGFYLLRDTFRSSLDAYLK